MDLFSHGYDVCLLCIASEAQAVYHHLGVRAEGQAEKSPVAAVA